MLRDVHDPELVRAVSGEYPFDVIFEHRRQPTGAASPPFAVVDALQPGQAHQPPDPSVTDPQPPAENQFGMHPADPIGSPRQLM